MEKIILTTTKELSELLISSQKSFIDEIKSIINQDSRVEEDELLTRKQVSSLCKISMSSINLLANKNILKRVRIGCRTFFSRKQVQEFINSQLKG